MRVVLVLLLIVTATLAVATEARAAVSYSSEEAAFVKLINDYRLSRGLPALLVSDRITEACDRHNSDMAKYEFFGHYTTNGSDWFAIGATPFDRMATSGYGFDTPRGENIAAGYSTASSVFSAWQASSGHNSNMLGETFKVLGVSLVFSSGSPYGYYWTVGFGGYVDETAHTVPAAAPTTPCESIRGTDRYDTAIRISRAMFSEALPAGSGLVLAPGETFPEALCGAPLAAAYGGPVLLTPAVGLNNGAEAEMQRLAPQYVFCIGLSDAVVNEVRSALPAATVTTIRGAGGSAYDMSYQVAKALAAKLGDMSDAIAIITRGDVFPDAIGLAPLACHQKWPVLLTGGTNTLSPSAADALAELGIDEALKVGTYVTLPSNVTGVGNLSGTDRYDTNRKVVLWGKANAGLSFSHAGVTTGDKFPDALATGPYLGLDRGVLFLSPLYGPLPAQTSALIAANATSVGQVTFIACVEPVISQVKSTLL